MDLVQGKENGTPCMPWEVFTWQTNMHTVIKTALQSVALAPQFQSTLMMMKTLNRWNCKATLIPQSF
jgi:hypothetical protein